MAAEAAAAAVAANDEGNGNGNGFSLGGVVRAFLWWFVISSAVKYFTGSGNQPKPSAADTSSNAVAVNRPAHRNLWRDGDSFDALLYISPDEQFNHGADQNELLWRFDGLRYNWDEDNTRSTNITVPVTPHLQKNGSAFAHVFLSRHGAPIDPSLPDFRAQDVVYATHSIIKFMRVARNTTEKNLLDSTSEDRALAAQQTKLDEQRPIVGHFCPVLEPRFVHDFSSFASGSLPPQMKDNFVVDPETNGYWPPIYFDSFWVLRDRYVALNDSVMSVQLEVRISPVSLMKWQFQAQMEASWAQQSAWGIQDESEHDEIRRIMLESNPWLLGVTMIVSVLHSVFDFLAFKNDIAFWRAKTNANGISVRTLIINLACQVIILLYLFDNDTSWMILISSAVGLAIECWKLPKVCQITFGLSGGWFGVLPWVSFQDHPSYVASSQAQHDKTAMRYLSYVLYPLVFGYSVWSLLYSTHRSWYSWVLSSLVGAVYMFGFILMCPQLYINYKLKSVAHLPWRMLTYKALNTFVDDLFAFVIKMPTMHRLACFRDDIVFFAFLYQKWKYRVDLTRTNEFGLTPNNDDDQDEPATVPSQPIEQATSDAESDSESADAVDAQKPQLRQRRHKQKVAIEYEEEG